MSDNIRPNYYRANIRDVSNEFREIECLAAIDGLDLNFNTGNALKYLWRAGRKDPLGVIEDLKKARTYLDLEISRRSTSTLPKPVETDPDEIMARVLEMVGVSEADSKVSALLTDLRNTLQRAGAKR